MVPSHPLRIPDPPRILFPPDPEHVPGPRSPGKKRGEEKGKFAFLRLRAIGTSRFPLPFPDHI